MLGPSEPAKKDVCVVSRLSIPRREVVRAYVVLPHAVPILAVLTATTAFAFVARGGWPGAADLACLLAAMLGGQLAVGAVNELADVELDRVSKPSKPIPAGLASERGARLMTWCGIAMMALASFRFSFLAFALCALGTGLGVAYSLWFKRSAWSWIPYILAIPLIPIWVWAALERVPASLLALYPIAIPALIAVQLAQSIPDVKADAGAGVRTLAVVLGEQAARRAVSGCVMLSIAIAALVAPVVVSRPGFVWISGGVGVVLMVVSEGIWRKDAHSGRMSAFPLTAGAVLVLGVGWALGMTG